MDGGRRRAQEGQLASVAELSARIVERRAGLFWCGVPFFALLAACGTASLPAAATQPSTQLVVGFPEATGDPELGAGQFAQLISLEGLTLLNVNGRALPRVAERWEWEKDGLALRVHLRPRVFLHDDRPFDAPTAAAILSETVKRPRNLALYPSLSDIVSVAPDEETKEDDLDIVIQLSKRSAFLPEDLSLQLSTGEDNTIGTGPYRLVKRSKEETVLERHSRYDSGVPSIRRIVVRPFDTLRTAWTSLLRGEVDMVSDVPGEAVEFVQNDEVQVINYKRWYQFLIAFNSSNEPFTKPAVRRALNLAIDRQEIIDEALRGYGVPASGPIWPQHWAYDDSVQPFGSDPRQAEALLDGAGYPRGQARALSPVLGARLRVTCLLPEGFSLLERIALHVQKQLYDVGVDMQFDVVTTAAYNQRIGTKQFDCVLIDLISGPTLARPYIFWRSARDFQGLNVFGFENAEAERLFQQLRESSNETAVRSATNRLQRVFLDDPPALFLVWNQRTRAIRREFQIAAEPERDPITKIESWTLRDSQAAPAE
jgi:peptide/nickel transport system substrate-binding protein